jgi:hypothetical protein
VALHDLQRRGAEAGVWRSDPAVGKVAIVRKEDPQGLVDAEQMAGARQQIRVIGERLPTAIARDGRAGLGLKP